MDMRQLLLVAALASPMMAQDFAPLDPAAVSHPGADAAPASSPLTYPDAAGFAVRRQLVIDGLKSEDLAKWRKGYFAGGDPGKYLPGAAMAKLLADPADAMARQYLNDDRSWREHYHFAAVNWGRVLPLFGQALTDETKARLADAAMKYDAYINGTGTENHRTMQYTTALVLPDWLPGEGGVARLDKATVKARQKEWLRGYVKNLYRYGMGEWDSSTYLAFTINGLLNIYDFSSDPEARLIAKAGLDLIVSGMALKYANGVFCGPHQRGFCDEPMESITDQVLWMWWGSTKPMTPADCSNFRYSLHAATSGYRPNALICRLAAKQLEGLPADYRNTKPNYWFGQQIQPKAGVYGEVVRVHARYVLGALLNGHGGQMTRWQLVVPDAAGARCVTGGSPMGRGDADGALQSWRYGDGNGMCDRTVVVGGSLISLTRIPSDEEIATLAATDVDRRIADGKVKPDDKQQALDRSKAQWLDHAFVSIPARTEDPVQVDGWWVMRLDQVWVAVRPLGADAAVTEQAVDPAAKRKEGVAIPRILRITGRRIGFVLHVISQEQAADQAALAALLAQCPVQSDCFAEDQTVSCKTPEGRQVTATWGDERLSTVVDGVPLAPPVEALYDGPHLQVRDGIMTLRNGSESFTVDFSGDLPVYR